MEEHPVQQPIASIEIDTIPDVQGSFAVGRNGVTRIEACQKSGLHANLPYVRVWNGDVCLAEFCQHNIVGVYFAAPATFSQFEKRGPSDEFTFDPDCIKAASHTDGVECFDCWMPF